MMDGNSVHYMSKSNEWTTPQDFFDRLNEEFSFTLDPAATINNAKCPKFFTLAEDGLQQDWTGERVFCNPPYGRQIGKWIEKCATEQTEVCVMLIPSRTDTKAWHRYIFNNPRAEVRFIEGRLYFGGASTCSIPIRNRRL